MFVLSTSYTCNVHRLTARRPGDVMEKRYRITSSADRAGSRPTRDETHGADTAAFGFIAPSKKRSDSRDLSAAAAHIIIIRSFRFLSFLSLSLFFYTA